MDALTKLLAVALPLLMLGLLGMGMLLIYLAGKTMLEAKKIDLVSVAIVILILLLIPVGIREYPPMLTDAFIDAFSAIWGKSGDIEAITNEIVNESSNRWNSSGDSPVIIPTVQFTPTPMPTIENPIDFNATATAYFGDFPTALPMPTSTPRPMVEPTRTPIPSPTVFICRSGEDVLAGCQPPTPIPGN